MRRWGAGIAIAVLSTWVSVLVSHADVGSDRPAAILVFPKLLVDTEAGLDTMIRITNTSDRPLNVLCFYVNVTPECSIPDGSCFPSLLACPISTPEGLVFGQCLPKWQHTDFLIRLTKEQPTGWLVSGGANVNCHFLDGVCSADGVAVCQRDADCAGPVNRCVLAPCLPLDGTVRRTVDGQINEGLVPLSPEDPFIGELKCIAVDEALAPTARNDLIGEALIGRLEADPDDPFIDVAGYNAIGIPAIPDTGNRDRTLVLGGEDAEYEGCPNILILDHFFDGAVDPVIRNFCQPDDTCSVSGTPCINDGECLDNLCQGGFCSVSGTPCATTDPDCLNGCIQNETCVGGSACQVSGTPCTVDADCPTDFCRLSGARCLVDADCADPVHQVRVATDLTLIPCTQDFETRNLDLSRTVAQFVVFNEFEQRFSTSRLVECFKETRLSDLDTTRSAADNSRSIFSAGVAGTLTGQSRIRGVIAPQEGGRNGNTLLGISEEFRCQGPKYEFPSCGFVNAADLVGSTGKNLHFQGRRPQSDFLYLP